MVNIGARRSFPGKLRVRMSEANENGDRESLRDAAPDQASLRGNWPGRPLPADEEAGPAEIVLGALRRHLWLAVSLLIASIVVAAAVGLSRTKVYRATATLQIDPRPPAPLGHGVEGVVELGSNSYWANIEYYNTQHELIRSLPVGLAVVHELSLQKDSAFLQNQAMPTPQAYEVEPEIAAAILRSRLAVFPMKESRLVLVTLDDANPSRAARILDAVVRAYVSHNMDQAVESTSSAVEWLGEQLESLRNELTASELALHEYKLKKQIASVGIDDQSDMLRGEIAQLTEERTRVRAKMQEAKARLSQLAKVDVTNPESIPQMELLDSHELKTLRTAYIESVRDHGALLGSGKGENHPDVHAALARVTATSRALSAEVQNIKNGAQKQLQALEQQEAGLRQLVNEAEHKALDLNLMEIEYNRLRRTKDNNEKLYGLVLERSKEAGLTQALRVNNIQVLAPAATSPVPVEPRMSLILAAGVMAGLALGLGAALGRERMDRTIKSLDELEQRLHLVPLGSLPEVAGGVATTKRRRRHSLSVTQPELVTLEQPGSGFAESVRAVRTNLLFMSPDQPFRRLLVTSAQPGEGKTTVASALAVAMAQAGQRVILIDCDMRRPRLHKIFSVTQGPCNLSESLLDPAHLDLASTRTELAKLSILPAGPTPPNPAELLQSEAFRHLLQRLEQDFDLVILDSPPLVVTDAAILATRVDGSVMVVRRGHSDRRDVLRAKRAILDVGGSVIGAVLNAVREADGRYGYGYGYGEGYGPSSTRRPPAQS
jgi:polysaccharide biosynthesis transport protein